MTALGHNRKSAEATRMSAFGCRADIIKAKADIASRRPVRGQVTPALPHRVIEWLRHCHGLTYPDNTAFSASIDNKCF